MKRQTFYLAILCLVVAAAFKSGPRRLVTKKLSSFALGSVDGDPEGRLSITTPLTETKNEISLREVFTSRTLNLPGMAWLTAGDTLLYASAGFFGFLCDVDPLMSSTTFWDTKVFSDSAFIAAGLSLAGFLFDRVPFQVARDIKSDTRFFTLRLIGRNTNWFKALSAATLVSGFAAVAEEVFFRGFLLTAAMALGMAPIFAGLLSSVLFGLAHTGKWGSNALVESLLGATFSACFVLSGFNLAVPIMVHFLYDVTTLFLTWADAASDLRVRMKRATERELLSLDPSDQRTFDSLIRATFDLLDLDGDDAIDLRELSRGLKWFGLASPHPFDRGHHTTLLLNNPEIESSEQTLTVKELFDKVDKNKDGKLSYFEFRELMSGGLFRWPGDLEVSAGTI
jgi:membrane protease YdiL (CAAX protease family)